MLSFLKNHPFAVEAFFERSLVLTYAVPKEELQGFLPESLTLDTFHDKWAFLAVAMVQTKDLRPKGFPAWMGNDFFLIGYRVFVQYHTTAGKRLRGLYILKSETNRRKMEVLGNIFTHYNYTTTDISQVIRVGEEEICSTCSAFKVIISNSETEAPLPSGTPFADWKEARRFAGPLPFTFTYNKTKKAVLIIEGVRENWIPVPVQVISHDFGFVRSLNLNGCILANAFVIRNIPYYWRKGRREQWG